MLLYSLSSSLRASVMAVTKRWVRSSGVKLSVSPVPPPEQAVRASRERARIRVKIRFIWVLLIMIFEIFEGSSSVHSFGRQELRKVPSKKILFCNEEPSDDRSGPKALL